MNSTLKGKASKTSNGPVTSKAYAVDHSFAHVPAGIGWLLQVPQAKGHYENSKYLSNEVGRQSQGKGEGKLFEPKSEGFPEVIQRPRGENSNKISARLREFVRTGKPWLYSFQGVPKAKLKAGKENEKGVSKYENGKRPEKESVIRPNKDEVKNHKDQHFQGVESLPSGVGEGRGPKVVENPGQNSRMVPKLEVEKLRKMPAKPLLPILDLGKTNLNEKRRELRKLRKERGEEDPYYTEDDTEDGTEDEDEEPYQLAGSGLKRTTSFMFGSLFPKFFSKMVAVPEE